MPKKRVRNRRKGSQWADYLNDEFAVLFEPPPLDMPEEIYLKAKKEAEDRVDKRIGLK